VSGISLPPAADKFPPRIDVATRTFSLREELGFVRETRALEIGRGALGRIADVFRQQFPARRALVVADPRTFEVAGKNVLGSLRKSDLALTAPLLLTDPRLYAEHTFVEQLEAAFKSNDAIPVAVGSGTINDLVKLASHRVGRPYLCVVTAASMYGYTAFGASITFHGSKQTFNCPAPAVVIADIDVIRRAPPEMTASGYADLLAKSTAGADWILADALGVEPLDSRACSLVQGGLRAALADPAGARAGEETAIPQLIEGLMRSGFAMQWSKSSRPASGAEHQFSHLWEMERHVHEGKAPSHGFKVGIATLAVSALYEEFLRWPVEQLDVNRCCARWLDIDEAEARVRKLFSGEDFTERAVEETRMKHVTPAELRQRLERLKIVWPELKSRLRAQLFPVAELRQRLKLVGAPTEPEELGLTRERVRRSFLRAYHIRRRFTVLDVMMHADLFDSLRDALFSRGCLWEIEPRGAKKGASL
jgi:glycerol-1-phosphate dehydrogenase [NAD(P)+]